MKKKSIGVAAIVGLLLVGIWLTTLRKGTENKQINTEPVTEVELIDPFLPTELVRPQRINWDNFEVTTEGETEKAVIKTRDWSGTEINRVVMALGEKITSIDQTGSWTTFGVKQKGGFIDRKNDLVEWQKEIISKEQIPKGKMLAQEDAREKITDMVERIVGQKISLVWEQTKYVKMLYPRWIECGAGEAEMMKIRADMEIDGKKITGFYGKMVEAVVGKDGGIVKLTVRFPPVVSGWGEKTALKNKEEIKKGRISNFGIKETNSNELVGLKNLNINATSGELVYVYSAGNSQMKPYWEIQGNTLVNSTPLRVSMLYGATK
jgi:hypothetical protein